MTGRTRETNYTLKTADGEALKYSVPPYKITPITFETGKPTFEVEKILSKRLNNNNEIEYLVKWKELEENENEWVTEEIFKNYSSDKYMLNKITLISNLRIFSTYLPIIVKNIL